MDAVTVHTWYSALDSRSSTTGHRSGILAALFVSHFLVKLCISKLVYLFKLRTVCVKVGKSLKPKANCLAKDDSLEGKMLRENGPTGRLKVVTGKN